MAVRFTDHAIRQFAERALDRAWVERTLQAPDWTTADPNHHHRFLAYRVVPERDGRILRVVYEHDGADLVVVTAFLDRAAQPPP